MRFDILTVENNHLDFGGDAFFGAKIEHFLRLGDAADQEKDAECQQCEHRSAAGEAATPLAAQESKRLGARKVMCIINNTAYVDLIQGGEIDIAISPQLATIGTLLTHVRRGDIVSAHSLRRGAAEAIEVVAHGDARSSKVVGRRIEEIDLPKGATIGAIVRQRNTAGARIAAGEHDTEDQVIMAHHDTMIEADDHVIVFVVNKRMVPQVEKLFQVSARFF